MYDRYGRFDQYGRPMAVARSASESALLLGRVCFLTVGALVCTAFGAAISAQAMSMGLMLVGLIGSFVMLFVCQAVARRYPVNLLALAGFALLEGLVFGPAVAIYARVNGPMVVVQAAVLSIVIFAMVGVLGYTSARSYANKLPLMLGGLIALIVFGVVLWFWHSAMANWIYSAAGALLFTAFIFVDFTRIRHDYGAEDYVPATISVYLDLINLFWFLLRLLGGSRRD